MEYLADNIIEIANIVYGIQGMQVIDYFVRKDMSEQLKEQYEADTNLKDTIREIHDNVAQEMYCKGVDDLCNEISTYRMYDEYGNVIDLLEIAKQLKKGNKE